jgi:hypothetical protein
MSYTVTCRTADGVEHIFDLPYANSCPIYNYDADFKFFISKTEAKKDPLEHNMYLAPAHSTCIEAPEPELGKVRVFDEENQVWNQVDDLSGMYYSTNPDTLGTVIANPNPVVAPENATRTPPPFHTENYTLVWNAETGDTISAASESSESGWSVVEANPVTPQEKLRNLGLTVEDLRVLLDL